MQHKPQSLLDRDQPIRILKKYRRQVGGEFATVRDVFWREEELWIVLQLPSGQRTAVPAAWTELSQDWMPMTSDVEIHPTQLIQLAKYCQNLGSPNRRQGGKTSHKRKAKK